MSICLEIYMSKTDLEGGAKKTEQTLFVILTKLMKILKNTLYHQKGHIHSTLQFWTNALKIKRMIYLSQETI